MRGNDTMTEPLAAGERHERMSYNPDFCSCGESWPCRISRASLTIPNADKVGLAEAWAAVELVLPEWWRIRSLTELRLDEWEAVAFEHNRIRVGNGETPEAALLALAACFEVPA